MIQLQLSVDYVLTYIVVLYKVSACIHVPAMPGRHSCFSSDVYRFGVFYVTCRLYYVYVHIYIMLYIQSPKIREALEEDFVTTRKTANSRGICSAYGYIAAAAAVLKRCELQTHSVHSIYIYIYTYAYYYHIYTSVYFVRVHVENPRAANSGSRYYTCTQLYMRKFDTNYKNAFKLNS